MWHDGQQWVMSFGKEYGCKIWHSTMLSFWKPSSLGIIYEISFNESLKSLNPIRADLIEGEITDVCAGTIRRPLAKADLSSKKTAK